MERRFQPPAQPKPPAMTDKGQCQFAEFAETPPRCTMPATRQWGGVWLCDEHGDRRGPERCAYCRSCSHTETARSCPVRHADAERFTRRGIDLYPNGKEFAP